MAKQSLWPVAPMWFRPFVRRFSLSKQSSFSQLQVVKRIDLPLGYECFIRKAICAFKAWRTPKKQWETWFMIFMSWIPALFHNGSTTLFGLLLSFSASNAWVNPKDRPTCQRWRVDVGHGITAWLPASISMKLMVHKWWYTYIYVYTNVLLWVHILFSKLQHTTKLETCATCAFYIHPCAVLTFEYASSAVSTYHRQEYLNNT